MQVRHALRAEITDAAAVLAAAFSDDPWFRWLYPGTEQWPAAPQAWFQLVLSRAFRSRHTYVSEAGACNWIPPDVEFPAEEDVASAVELLGAQIGDRATTAFEIIRRAGAAFHDLPPRFHCVYVGVAPPRQRCGVGRALLGRVLDHLDADGIPASLTSTNDVNLPFYRSLGFREIGAVAVPESDATLRPMWREPRPQ